MNIGRVLELRLSKTHGLPLIVTPVNVTVAKHKVLSSKIILPQRENTAFRDDWLLRHFCVVPIVSQLAGRPVSGTGVI